MLFDIDTPPKTNKELRVHLDHLIKRQSIRYVPIVQDDFTEEQEPKPIPTPLRYDDIQRDEHFDQFRKPDFQRETNAWSPKKCVAFLESVVNGRIVPSIILWRSPENRLFYILDGAHRLSVLRAWMKNDWGDSSQALDSYQRRDITAIKVAAAETRQLIDESIGQFANYRDAGEEYQYLTDNNQAPRLVMDQKRYAQAVFYRSLNSEHHGLLRQWEHGNYETAEQSFLRINRGGQALDPWEENLIEYRKGSYARCIMCIANGGESGSYWPQLSKADTQNPELNELIASFSNRARLIYKRLFVPPFLHPVKNMNVPLMVAPDYFQPHKYLFEIIPLIVYRRIAESDNQQIEFLKRDTEASVETVVKNADFIFARMSAALEHLVGPANPSANSNSLSVVPLFYFYNKRGGYDRAFLYGFIYWLLDGAEDEIKQRKQVFTGNRDRFEMFLFQYKREIADYKGNIGAGLKSTRNVANFFQALLTVLHENAEARIEELADTVLQSMSVTKTVSRREKSTRHYSNPDKTEMNISQMFENSVRCHICGGIVDLQSSLQYDHVDDYARTKVTNPETGHPSHPFCNLFKQDILAYRRGEYQLVLPPFTGTIDSRKSKKSQQSSSEQLVLPLEFFGEDNFPE